MMFVKNKEDFISRLNKSLARFREEMEKEENKEMLERAVIKRQYDEYQLLLEQLIQAMEKTDYSINYYNAAYSGLCLVPRIRLDHGANEALDEGDAESVGELKVQIEDLRDSVGLILVHTQFSLSTMASKDIIEENYLEVLRKVKSLDEHPEMINEADSDQDKEDIDLTNDAECARSLEDLLGREIREFDVLLRP